MNTKGRTKKEERKGSGDHPSLAGRVRAQFHIELYNATN
jgi:hypothetical protein